MAEVMRTAEHELRQLIEERAEITKRIGSIKQTIVGLAKLFGALWTLFCWILPIGRGVRAGPASHRRAAECSWTPRDR